MGKYFVQISVLVVIISTLSSCIKTKNPELPPLQIIQRAGLFKDKAVKMVKSQNYEVAILYFQKAAKEFSKNRKSRLGLLHCYINIGNCYLELKDFENSELYLDKAMKLAFTIPDYKDFRLAQSFRNLGKNSYMRRDFKSAINHYEKALQIINRLYGSDHQETARIYNSLSQSYFNLGDHHTAQIYSEKSLSIKLRTRIKRRIPEKSKPSIKPYKEAYGIVHDKVATIYHKKGVLDMLKGHYDEALKKFQKSISILFSMDQLYKKEITEIYLDTAKCYHSKNNLEEATHYLQLIKGFIKKNRIPDFRRAPEVEYRLALIALDKSQYTKALRIIQNAIKMSSKEFYSEDFACNPSVNQLSTENIVLNILFTKAELLRQLYHYRPQLDYLKSSNRTFRLITQLIYRMRKLNIYGPYRHIFNTRCTPIYSKAVSTALKLYQITRNRKFIKDAMTYTEAGKAAILTDMVLSSKTSGNRNIPQDLRKKERTLYYKLNTFNLFMNKKDRSEEDVKQKMVNFRQMYHHLLLEHTTMVNFLENQYPERNSEKVDISLPDIDSLIETIDNQSALIEYYLIGRKLIIYVITNKNIEIFTRNLEKNIKDKVEKFCQSIRKIEEQNYIKLSGELYRDLIEPIDREIAKKKRLIIIPHGILYQLPFEALASSQNVEHVDFQKLNYLIKRFSIEYNYSAQLWGQKCVIPSKDFNFIGFAPIFRGGKSLSLKDFNGEPTAYDLPELPHSEREVKSIIDIFKKAGRKAAGFFKGSASEETFRDAIESNNNQVIHIASHSIVNSSNPLLSGILFGGSNSNKRDNGILYSGEIFNLKLNPPLLVLSSCDSGAGKLIENDGLAGINRAFIYSGARNIIFSFWKVDDKSTSEIMIEFYRNLIKSANFTESLRQAKLKMMKNEFTSFPKYWSSFIIVSSKIE